MADKHLHLNVKHHPECIYSDLSEETVWDPSWESLPSQPKHLHFLLIATAMMQARETQDTSVGSLLEKTVVTELLLCTGGHCCKQIAAPAACTCSIISF